MGSVPADRQYEAYTVAQVLRLTKVTRRQLDYWVAQDVVSADIDRRVGQRHVRLFSFTNLLEIKTAAWLRDRVSLQLIRKIVDRLRDDLARPLAEVRVAIIEGRRGFDVIIQREDGTWERGADGQQTMELTVPLGRLEDELRQEDRRARARKSARGQVERQRGRLGSAEVVAGTRVPTETLRQLSAAGWSAKRILDNYPGLHSRDLEAALNGQRVG